jgi:hypothetical protein
MFVDERGRERRRCSWTLCPTERRCCADAHTVVAAVAQQILEHHVVARAR